MGNVSTMPQTWDVQKHTVESTLAVRPLIELGHSLLGTAGIGFIYRSDEEISLYTPDSAKFRTYLASSPNRYHFSIGRMS